MVKDAFCGFDDFWAAFKVTFLGWALLCGITFGIAAIWVIPYMQATYTNAYNLLKQGAVAEN